MSVWYAGRNAYGVKHRPRYYVERLLGQPEDGFDSISEVAEWLIEQGHVQEEETDEGKSLRGWGDEFCAVSGERNDPWEKQQ